MSTPGEDRIPPAPEFPDPKPNPPQRAAAPHDPIAALGVLAVTMALAHALDSRRRQRFIARLQAVQRDWMREEPDAAEGATLPHAGAALLAPILALLQAEFPPP